MFSPIFDKSACSMTILLVTMFYATSMILIFVLTPISKGMVPVSKLDWDKTSS